MNTETIFKRLGIAKHAHSVYQTLQKNGALHVSDIAKKTGIYRPSTYKALKDLVKSKFVISKVEGKRTLYEVTNPKLIAEAFANVSKKVALGTPNIALLAEKHFDEKVRFMEGRVGIRKAFDDVIEHTPKGETFYRYTSEQDLAEVNSYLSRDYRTRRDAKKLERMVISNPKSGKQKRSRLERFIKYIPPERNLFEQNIIQIVYGDRLLFIDINLEKVVIIENKALAEFQKVIFQQLYRALP